ncbi:protein SOB FIVE-LIKE 5 isoform X2 [Ziziphus jujuba]|uniref:Protein SOB FIVE-LIKE 5 isoform X2 n=1 Tax=Ziziphus jujuba TaxID=326968 RepID=A0A6P4B386_ZIZJJ|nr:protein SOB FIVE-LIKE 5 isoform X2 [Ziziphus jujuba]
MNVMASECSSGCESGWTVYLEQSLCNNGFINGNGSVFCDGNYYKEKRSDQVDAEEEEGEEDLSMVSDASSGPPHFQEDEVVFNVDHNSCFYPDSKDVRLSKTSGKKKKNSREQFGRCGGQVQESSFLDDTASSPVYNFSMNDFARSNNQASMQSVLEFSQGLSATNFEGRSAYQEYPFGFFQSSLSGTQRQKNQWFEEKGWE